MRCLRDDGFLFFVFCFLKSLCNLLEGVQIA